MDKPLVSLCITCYNQARFIREAVQSAFDQTYDPLEIVICDDHSTDGTDKIVAALVDDYRTSDGRHKVVFKRNEANLYVMKNYEQAFRMAHGELLITGAGDDISMPNRAERIVEAWEKSGRKATCILHGMISIDEHGNELGCAGPRPIEYVLGATVAYSNVVVSNFPRANVERVVHEDYIFTNRALMYGTELYLNGPLIKYRQGVGLSTGGDFATRRIRVSLSSVVSCDFTSREFDENRFRIACDRAERIKAVQRWRENRYQPEFTLFTSKSFFARLSAYRRLSPDLIKMGDYVFYTEYLSAVFPRPLNRIVSRIVSYCYRIKWKLRRMLKGER